MKIAEIKKLIEQGESGTLEFKKSTSQLKAVGETLCAFLNGSGGFVLVGVTDEGKMIGQHVTDNTRQEIAKTLRLLEPFPSLEVAYVSIPDDKHVIAISTTQHNNSAPYIFNGRAYQRNQSITSRMSQELYQTLLMERLNDPKHWETEPAKNINVDDLDENEIIKTIQEGVASGRIEAKHLTSNYKKALVNLKLLQDDVPTNAAVVLFAKDVLPKYAQCMMRLARFKGTTKSEFIDNQQVFGNFFHILNVAMDFIQRHMPIAGKIEPGKVKRTDKPLIPIRAIREALVNSLCHRDYTLSNRSISLGIYDDRLELTSPGRLPRSISIEKLKTDHDSCPRNKIIANVLFRRGIIEQWGSGTSEMIELCHNAHLDEPEFIEDDNMFVVRFKAKFAVGQEATYEAEERLTDRQKEILRIIRKQNICSPKYILDNLSVSVTDRTLRNDLAELANQGLVVRQGKGPQTVWIPKKSKQE